MKHVIYSNRLQASSSPDLPISHDNKQHTHYLSHFMHGNTSKNASNQRVLGPNLTQRVRANEPLRCSPVTAPRLASHPPPHGYSAKHQSRTFVRARTPSAPCGRGSRKRAVTPRGLLPGGDAGGGSKWRPLHVKRWPSVRGVDASPRPAHSGMHCTGHQSFRNAYLQQTLRERPRQSERRR